MVKAIKALLIPNNVQKTKMFQYAGASRFAYNWALAREIENAGTFAEKLMEHVMLFTGGHAPDDMTIVVSGIWEK